MNEERNNGQTLLSVRDLHVHYSSGGEMVKAVNGVSFDLEQGKSLGLVGETGAGKTTIAKAILQILPDHSTKLVEGEISFKGRDILKISEQEMQAVRGKEISMVFQDPMTALNPVMTVGDQISEGIWRHQKVSKAAARQEAIKMLETVGISRDRIDEYPHQFSGGMKQRVVIAIALACSPELLIADEPTTALDVTIQAQVLDLIKELKKKHGTSLILITHDLGVVADTCDRVAVIYAGEVVEIGSLEEVFDHPTHPYTIGLFGAIPDMYKDVNRLSPIAGLPPNPAALPEGCYFAPRCPHATERCRSVHSGLERITGTHFVRCIKNQQEG